MPLTHTVSLGCDRPTDCDRCVLNLLYLHLMQLEGDDPTTCSPRRVQLRPFKQALNQGRVIRLAIDGRVKCITPQAAQLLNQYFDSQDSSGLPEALQQWCSDQISQLNPSSRGLPLRLPFSVQHRGQQLLIHLIPDPIGEQYFLLLEEQEPPCFSIAALESLGLTQREAEVLFWVARDKSNAAIAKVLDCCEGTVRKHLEHLYKKLEVQTRIGAVMTALERLGLLQA